MAKEGVPDDSNIRISALREYSGNFQVPFSLNIAMPEGGCGISTCLILKDSPACE